VRCASSLCEGGGNPERRESKTAAVESLQRVDVGMGWDSVTVSRLWESSMVVLAMLMDVGSGRRWMGHPKHTRVNREIIICGRPLKWSSCFCSRPFPAAVFTARANDERDVVRGVVVAHS
jgi:hypothetical protein